MRYLIQYLAIFFFTCVQIAKCEFESQDMALNGFVEFPSQDNNDDVVNNLDFSNIEIHLLDENLNLVDKTVCANNGFYLLPIHDRKKLLLKVVSPDDLVFQPRLLELDLTDKSDQQLKEILDTTHNFKFIGFSAKGRVKTLNQQTGPSNIELQIFDQDNKYLQSTFTEQDGDFIFSNLIMGKYFIRPLNVQTEQYKFKEQQREMECEVNWKKSDNCKGDLIVEGYSFQGRILNENQPLDNFHIFLYSKTNKAITQQCQELKQIEQHPQAGKQNYICYAVTDAQGKFSFKYIPNGEYSLYIKSFVNENLIDIEPKFIKVLVNNQAINQNFNFDINQFSISGRVLDQKGQGIVNVKILLDGEEKAISNAHGEYTLDKIKTGTYTIDGSHDHLYFESIQNVRVSVNLKEIPPLVLNQIHVCGYVNLNMDNVGSEDHDNIRYSKVTIYLESKTEKIPQQPDSKTGHYCFVVKPDKYVIYPVIVQIDNSNQQEILSLFPKQHEVELIDKPLLDLNFYRPKVRIDGQVKFLQSISDDQIENTFVTLTLLRQQDKKQQNSKKLQTKLDSQRRFNFMNVLAGQYSVQIQNDKLCFEKQSQIVDITQNQNISNIIFRQQGYQFQYNTKSDLSVNLIDPEGASTKVQLRASQKNVGSYCLEKQGRYKIQALDCYEFAQNSNLLIDTQSLRNEVVNLISDKFLIQGKLFLDAKKFFQKNSDARNILPETLQKNNYLLLESYSLDTNELIETSNVNFKYLQTIDDQLQFEYKTFVRAYTKNKIIAQINQKINYDQKIAQDNNNIVGFIENLLFYPPDQTVEIIDHCINHLTNFQIKSGLVINGQILPSALNDIKVSVFVEDHDNKINKIQLLSIKTNNNSFKLGPFIDSNKYKVEIEKSGYKFDLIEETNKDNILELKFKAQQLSTISIKVLDSSTEEPIPGVLIYINSMSKTNQVRINNYTNDAGVFENNNFLQGEYLIKAVLKEYQFEPFQKTINIKDGAQETIVFKGKKVAFSIYGKVINLNQQGIQGVTVNALSQSQNKVVESTKTDKNGYFRIRGLNPKNYYNIQLNANNQNIEYYKPEQVKVFIESKDIQDIEFLIFEQQKNYDIQGLIQVDNQSYNQEEIEEIQSTLLVELYQQNNNEFVQVQNPKKIEINNYFEYQDLQKGVYQVRVSYRIGRNAIVSEIKNTYDLTALSENQYKLNEQIKIFKQTKQESNVNQNKGTVIFGPIMFLVVIFSLFNIDRTKQLLNKVLMLFQSKEQQQSLQQQKKKK